jgi:hypothetical protein
LVKFGSVIIASLFFVSHCFSLSLTILEVIDMKMNWNMLGLLAGCVFTAGLASCSQPTAGTASSPAPATTQQGDAMKGDAMQNGTMSPSSSPNAMQGDAMHDSKKKPSPNAMQGDAMHNGTMSPSSSPNAMQGDAMHNDTKPKQ